MGWRGLVVAVALLLPGAAGAIPYDTGRPSAPPPPPPPADTTTTWQRCATPTVDPDERVKLCHQVLDQGIRSDELVWIMLGRAYEDEDDRRNALDSYSHAVTQFGSVNTLGTRAQYYAENGEYDLAMADIATAAKTPGHEAEIDFMRCWIRAVAEKEMDAGLADCDAAIKLVAGNNSFMSSRAFILFKLGRLDEALTEYNAVLMLFPRTGQAYYMRAAIERKLGIASAAASDLATALTLEPNIERRYKRFGIAPPG